MNKRANAFAPLSVTPRSPIPSTNVSPSTTPPADPRKEGPAYDLPIAVGLLLASEQIQADLSRTLIIGELSLDGAVRHTNGVLPMAALARECGFDTLFVPASDAPEAALVPDQEVLPIESLFALTAHLQNLQPRVPYRPAHDFSPVDAPAYAVDFSEVRGQEHVKRALEIAAAGQHNVLMMGPPGAGKTLVSTYVPGTHKKTRQELNLPCNISDRGLVRPHNLTGFPG